MDVTFRPRLPNRAKAMLVTTSVAFPTITANTTTHVHVPKPARRAYLVGLTAHCSTVGVDADGTILATAKRYDFSATADVTCSSAKDIEAMVAFKAELFSLLGGTTQLFAKEDLLRVAFVNNSAAIDTQPANGYLVAEWALLD